MRKRLLLLGVIGVLLSLAVAGAALVSLSEVSAVTRELANVNRALHHHQRADEMHDALRADVARAELVAAGRRRPAGAARVLRDTERHIAVYRGSISKAGSVPLDPGLEAALDQLHTRQDVYVQLAETLVRSWLTRGAGLPADRVAYNAAYKNLVPLQAKLSQRLMAASTRVESDAAAEKARADRVIASSAALALAGWLIAVAWHLRSIGTLQRALVREAEQRSAADVLQRSLLPERLPSIAGSRLAARSLPGTSGQRVGGDWYDVITLPTGQVALVVGDVVGHDLPAAAAMGQLRNVLRAYALEDGTPTSVLARLSRAAYLTDDSELATCICAVLDPLTMSLEWSSAGHLPPLVVSADGTGEVLTGEPGPPLGVSEHGEFPYHRVQLRPGDTVVLFSDGLVERRGTPIDTGLANLARVPVADLSPDAMCDRLLGTLLTNESPHEDDVTLLLLHVDGEPDPRPVLTPAPAAEESPVSSPARG